MRRIVLPATLVLLVLASGAQAQAADDSGYAGPPVELQLFGHIYDLLEAVPMNAHPMDPQAPDLARGYTEPVVAPTYGGQLNRLHFFNSMGPVEYNASLAQPRIHPERGLALDLVLDPSKDILVHWFMSADAAEVRQLNFEPPVHAGAVPKLTVRAELRLGNDVRKDLTAGELVASGATTVDLLTAPGQPEVLEIVINLGKAQVERIGQRDGFNLGVEWYQVDASGSQVLQPGWNLHTGAAYPNRLVLPVGNPLYLYFVEPQFQDDKVAINAAFNSPLGNYDVDVAALQIDIVGPGNFRAKTLSQPVTIQHSYQHNEHNVATLQGWLWDYQADSAPLGTYTVTVRGSNLQGNAWAEKSATFVIEEEGDGVAIDSEGAEVVTEEQLEALDNEPKRSPGFEPLLLLALAPLALRRRQGS